MFNRTAAVFQRLNTFELVDLTKEEPTKGGVGRKVVKVADLKLEKILLFASLSAASRYMDIGIISITRRLKNPERATPILERFLVTNSDASFDLSFLDLPIIEPREPLSKRGKVLPIPVKIKDIETGRIYHFDTIEQACAVLPISPGRLATAVAGWSKTPVIKRRYLVCKEADKFPEIKPGANTIRVNLSTRRKTHKFRITKDGKTVECLGFTKLSKLVGTSKTLVYKYCVLGYGSEKVLNGWELVSPSIKTLRKTSQSLYENVLPRAVRFNRFKRKIQQAHLTDASLLG